MMCLYNYGIVIHKKNQKFDMDSNTENDWIDIAWEEYPFLVKLVFDENSYCGGSIISLENAKGNGVILTAAHCWDGHVPDGTLKVDVYVGCTSTLCNDDELLLI